jgi:endonuclease III
MRFRQARTADANDLARRAILFTMLSPQTRFDANVEAFRNVLPIWRDANVDAIQQAVRSTQFSYTKARNLVAAREFLADPFISEKMTRKNLRDLDGMGNKTTSFALALYNDLHPVFTLDLHILRAVAWATGHGADVNVIIRDAAYPILEEALVDWSRRRGVESPFVAQWSLWNAWGFNRHISHLPILE